MSKNTAVDTELNRLEILLIHAKDFTPHKVEYYKTLIKDHKQKNK
jgi:hypothetical protein